MAVDPSTSAAPRIPYYDERNVTDVESLPDFEEWRAQVQALRTEIGPPDARGGWLSTLVMNLANRYLSFPDAKFTSGEMRMVVDGFMAEIAALREAVHAE